MYKQGPTDYLHEYASINIADHGDMLTGKDFKMLADLKKAKKVTPERSSERYKWIYLLNNFHKLKKTPDFLRGSYFERVIEIANKLNRTKMEELMDFISDLHAQDRQKRACVEAKAEGKVEGKAELIQNFIENRPKGFKITAASIAALFGVDEQMAQSVLSV
ncbi:Rpn family recombination-promoting nuclease/putative transposase [Arachidicoccus terrestris]|uniref:Rpn family recombination-promoting nuclease/putative transposase n=1 Tax=Arachidicoccus terrestris TaxID=2875539 RepID=UPI0021D41FB6|nr:Rpn family recombination-promoting nuclease/putative transposase [Arachidicoccus terrestris]UAY55424.1 Rpn family recombination-promoting nuclease/putative transposase [Arachidicoccus terrestris]